MRRKIHLIFLLIIILQYSLIAREIRSLWALPWNLSSPKAIDQLVYDAVASRQTEILAEVRYRADALYIPNRLNMQYYNPEPRSSIISSLEFDPLDYLLLKAHEQGIEVQAWVTVFCATTTQADRLQNNFLYRYHDDWIMTDVSGRRMGLANQMGYFIDPGIPDVQEHLYNVFMDIATGYPELDGIHLDYIRYPTKNYGYHPVSVKRYHDALSDIDQTWNDWRVSQVTGFVKRLHDGIKSNNPRMLLTAAVISYIDEARIHYAQDWVSWLEDGIVDRVYPMAYASGNKLFNKTVNEIAAKTLKDKVVVGLRAWQEPGVAYYGVERIIEKAEYSRKLGFGGIALFSYEGVKKANMLSALTNAIYYWSDAEPETALDDQFITELVQILPEAYARKDTLAYVADEKPVPAKPNKGNAEISSSPYTTAVRDTMISIVVKVPMTEKKVTEEITVDKQNEIVAQRDSLVAVEEVSPNQVRKRTVELVNEFEAQNRIIQSPAYCENISFDNKYYFSFFFDSENRWKWFILDINDIVVYEKFRTYPGGHVIESWDGIANSGEIIPPGVYMLKIVNEYDTQVFQKRFLVY